MMDIYSFIGFSVGFCINEENVISYTLFFKLKLVTDNLFFKFINVPRVEWVGTEIWACCIDCKPP